MPLPLLTSVPPEAEPTEVMTAPSGSVSLASSCAAVSVIGVPTVVMNMSLRASGAPSLTGVTLTVMVFGAVSNRPLASRTLKLKFA